MNISLAFILLTLITVTGCGGGGGGGATPVTSGGTTANPVYGQYNSPNISFNSFLDALQSVDGHRSYSASTPNSLNHSYYVIWDPETNKNIAVDMQYIRTIVYFDYYSNDQAVAAEFRQLQASSSNPDGSRNDDHRINWEYVDTMWMYNWDEEKWQDNYVGRISGTYYEDEMQTTDVSLMSAEKEHEKFIRKAAQISAAFHMSLSASLSMVSLGNKIETMISRNNGELTNEDESALLSSMQALTGVSFADIAAAAEDADKKDEVISKIAAKLGTSAQNLEQRILPEVLGITL